MSNPRQILDERLARGEITPEEHNKLAGMLSQSTSKTEEVVTGTVKAVSAGFTTIFQFIGGGIIVFGLIAAYRHFTVETFPIGNITASSGQISFRVSNQYSEDRDVVFWIEQDGFSKCERIATIRGGYNHTITINCPSLSAGKFTLHAANSKSNIGKANIATRI